MGSIQKQDHHPSKQARPNEAKNTQQTCLDDAVSIECHQEKEKTVEESQERTRRDGEIH
jgi:hypothetical protein